MVNLRSQQLFISLELLKNAYDDLIAFNLPSHLIVHNEGDEQRIETMTKELRLLAADFVRTADMCERALITWRGDND